VDNLKQYLAREMDHLQEEIARCAHEGHARLTAYVHEVVSHVRKEYGTIHHDFRHDIDDALHPFVRALDPSLHAFHLRMPRRFS